MIWVGEDAFFSAVASGLVHLQLCCPGAGGGLCAFVALVPAACVCDISKLAGVKL